MITLGITGRSGCGKSTVTGYFQSIGIPCADADRIAREVLEPSSPCLAELAEAFGPDIFEDGVLMRRRLADRAFATPEGTQKLTGITHPEIVRRIYARRAEAEKAGAWLFCVDGAVIIGSEFEAACDKIAVVCAPFEVSVSRICARDGISPEMAARRLNAQVAEADLRQKADFLLPNDTTPEALTIEAAALIAELRKGALS
jgi:dephospho-CoA kinase